MAKVVIIGAGITGLTTAYWLKDMGVDVEVYEASQRLGGNMISERRDGYLVDFGPNSGLETTPLIPQLVEAAELSDARLYANREGAKRYVLRDGKIHSLPMGALAFLRTPLFSARAKLRLMAEPFIGRSDDGYNQSVADFVRRRLGQEFLDYAINPFIAGVYAGDPKQLSVKSALPKLYALEEQYGGLIKGAIIGARKRKKSGETSKQKAKMFSFRDGMQSFPEALGKTLEGRVHTGHRLSRIEKTDKGYELRFELSDGLVKVDAPLIFTTIPAKATAELIQDFDQSLAAGLRKIYYPPVKVLYLGYDAKAVGQALDGFGFLIPERENRSFLGAIWSSAIFPHRAPEGKVSFTLFIGGARQPELFELDSAELEAKVIADFNEIMKISVQPEFKAEKMWPAAIPQYNVGYIEHLRAMERFEAAHPGFLLGGNYRGGIALGDCVKNSRPNAERILSLLQ